MNNKLYKYMNWPVIEDVVFAESDDPHAVLGAHPAGNSTLIQTYQPGAQKAVLILKESREKIKMEMADEEGFFAALAPQKNVEDYLFEITFSDGTVKKVEDPYRFKPQITRQDTDRFEAEIGRAHV